MHSAQNVRSKYNGVLKEIMLRIAFCMRFSFFISSDYEKIKPLAVPMYSFGAHPCGFYFFILHLNPFSLGASVFLFVGN